MRLSLPHNLVHAVKYLRAVMASTSIAHKHNLRNKVTMPLGGDDLIALRWRSVFEMDWGTLPDKPPPW